MTRRSACVFQTISGKPNFSASGAIRTMTPASSARMETPHRKEPFDSSVISSGYTERGTCTSPSDAGSYGAAITITPSGTVRPSARRVHGIPFPMTTVAALRKQGVLCAKPTQRLVGLDVVLLGRAESHPRCKSITCSCQSCPQSGQTNTCAEC